MLYDEIDQESELILQMAVMTLDGDETGDDQLEKLME